jgi:hypothetical protein
MDPYKKYSAEDFIWDDSFRQWVFSPTRESNQFWNLFREENPEMELRMQQAREVVLALKIYEPAIPVQEINKFIQRTLTQGLQYTPSESNNNPVSHPTPFFKQLWFRAAASIIIITGLGVWFWRTSPGTPPDIKAYQTERTQMGSSLVEKINTSDSPLRINLQEGSKVTLLPGSRLSYQSTFNPEEREVYLLGEAFFEITADPNRPFLVYANELVTKVLGTSFWVKAREGSTKITVEVKTGRVSVYTKPQLGKDGSTAHREMEGVLHLGTHYIHHRESTMHRRMEGVVLYPNQKIIYARKEIRMIKTLVEKPEIVAPKPKMYPFIFEDSPMSQVFRSLEKAYGVDIVYDENVMKRCPLTATLTDLTLYEKLDVICKAIEARYEIIDGKIVIQGKGCKN